MSHNCNRPPLRVDYKIPFAAVARSPYDVAAAAAMKLDGNMNVMSRSNTWPVVVVHLEHDGGAHETDDGPCTAVTDDVTGLFGVGGGRGVGGRVNGVGGGDTAADTAAGAG
ncbi:uncharacterized protein LOC112604277 [Melanaphis sacchari]|uniref:uncharacterized protein LOC112604277 n=1 Tax=Melanaphis sacchari TaxID=742174 RepID=UPI000DC13595|nr:uncharacterized protein LOC112604277 [Melanaphis sacchari]